MRIRPSWIFLCERTIPACSHIIFLISFWMALAFFMRFLSFEIVWWGSERTFEVRSGLTFWAIWLLNTRASSRELDASLFAPGTPVQAASPNANSRLRFVRPLRFVLMPPHV